MSGSDTSRRIRLRRDSQQWEFDRAIRDTGKVYHFQPPGKGGLPSTVRMHDMISKQVGKQAQRLEKLAKTEAVAGHDETALEHYYEAALKYAQAQHPIFANNQEKRYLHAASLRCYDEVRQRSPLTIEHVEIAWRDTVVTGYLHLADVPDPAPLVFYIPGCDMTKEFVPHPLYNWAAQRGMHLFVFDGPGQGEANLRGIKLEVDNYEDAASTALTALLVRPEVEPSKVGVFGISFGSWWGARFAATDDRLAAAVLPWSSLCDKYYLFETDSPRYKQLFSYLTGATSEAELDDFAQRMGLEDLLPRIASPTLITVGEYDARSPIEEMYQLFDLITAPSELWVFEDQHHHTNVRSGDPMWRHDINSMGMDWLRDRFSGSPVAPPHQTLYIASNGGGPNDPYTPRKRYWFEE